MSAKENYDVFTQQLSTVTTSLFLLLKIKEARVALTTVVTVTLRGKTSVP